MPARTQSPQPPLAAPPAAPLAAPLAAPPTVPRTRHRPPNRVRTAAALVVAGCLVAPLGACSGGSDDADESSSGGSGQVDGTDAQAAPEDVDGPRPEGGGALRDSSGSLSAGGDR